MPPVTVLILAPEPDPGAGPLVRLLDEARTDLAERHRQGFLAAGAAEAVVRREPADATPFGARLRRLVSELRPQGLVVLGAGAVPLATADDRRAFVEAAAADEPRVLANNRYSADILAIAHASEVLASLPPDLAGDNALPRWIHETARVDALHVVAGRWLTMDVDSPLDLLLLEAKLPGLPGPTAADAAPVRHRLEQLRGLVDDPGAELLVAGRTSARMVRWLEQATRSRTRALIEERGLKTASIGATLGRPNRRPPRSLLASLLQAGGGPGALGDVVVGVADGALVDSRVLIAHRCGADEAAWPAPEDRFASDLLLAERVRDPWLAELTAAAAEALVPILLGGHSLVGPGLRLALRPSP
jgi:hypothetical protein